MLEILKVVVSVVLFYCLMFCGHRYWINKAKDLFWKSVLYVMLGWVGIYLIQYLLNN